MVFDLRKIAAGKLLNVRGWTTLRKVIVIESDDWGSIRMPDKATYNMLLSKGIRVDKCPYSRYDCLASGEDLASLFELLNDFRDVNGNPPVITANSVMVNPDFDEIRKTDFNEYHYELFTETFKKYPNHSQSFQLWKEGISNGLFHPQFHGREHLHVMRWMKALKQNLPETRLAFDLKLFGMSTTITSEKRKSYLAAFDIDDINDKNQIKNIITDGLLLFKKLIGYSSLSFVAPNYIWSSDIEQDLSKQCIKYIKGQAAQLSPDLNSLKTKKIRHYTGQKNSHNQLFIVRNCQFEPSINPLKDSVNECLAQIEDAFRWRKPAIITTHRVNFIGSIEQSNRDKNLPQLKRLLSAIQKKWPEVEFLSADRLGNLIDNSNGGTI